MIEFIPNFTLNNGEICDFYTFAFLRLSKAGAEAFAENINAKFGGIFTAYEKNSYVNLNLKDAFVKDCLEKISKEDIDFSSFGKLEQLETFNLENYTQMRVEKVLLENIGISSVEYALECYGKNIVCRKLVNLVILKKYLQVGFEASNAAFGFRCIEADIKKVATEYFYNLDSARECDGKIPRTVYKGVYLIDN